MHPEAGLSCVGCHGGDGEALGKNEAHPHGPPSRIDDERVPPKDKDLIWAQFTNPMDLRVVGKTCGTCHADLCDNLRASLHGTTAGHLSDGYYEMGLLPRRGAAYSVFPEDNPPKAGGEVKALLSLPPFSVRGTRGQLSTHYTDLPRKECMQCHLWSEGRAVRGRVGFDGDYRGSGCAACHVEYGLDGLSQSSDRSVNKFEPGHPRQHSMTRAPTTQACGACHYGDASIGLHFRGLSQLPPNAPGGPEIPGTTNRLMNRVFYMDDPAIVPPDVHHERGMHCIDCHTLGDVMGDGQMHGSMERAVEISCSACHGTFAQPSDLATERGTPLVNLRREGDRVILTSKVDGQEHAVPQVVHVLDPARPEYNRRAARAMTPAHAGVECYTCHAGWNANFLGFHFSRQEQLTQLDLLTGKRTPGRVTTQEKVFSTWKSFYAGLNERGRVAPYLTGFSTMGSVWDEEGRLILDEVMPVTAEGLSGMTMIHHQPHSTRPTARDCVECHRSSATWGMGSTNYRLARQLAFVADRRGVEVVGIDRTEFTRSAMLTKIVVPDVVDIAAHVDALQGHAHHLYVAEGGRGIHVVDVTTPTDPRQVGFVSCINPRGMELTGNRLYVADGIGGLKIYDVGTPGKALLVGAAPTFDAHDVEISWPWAFVADGPGGLCIFDVSAPATPILVAQIPLNGGSKVDGQAIAVESLFQYSRPTARNDGPGDRRTTPRNLCAVLDRRKGMYLIDVTEPSAPVVLHPRSDDRTQSIQEMGMTFRGLALRTQVDLADSQGGERTMERDYAYVLVEREIEGGEQRSRILLVDITDPTRVATRERTRVGSGYSTEQLIVADYYDAPRRRRLGFAPGALGVEIADLSTSREPVQVGVLPGLIDAYCMAVEEFPLDLMVDEEGKPQKDVSHAGSAWLSLQSIGRILSVSGESLGLRRSSAEVGRFGEAARLHLAQLDLDGSGFLQGEELARGGASLDRDGDHRISLLELGAAAGLFAEAGDEHDEESGGSEITRGSDLTGLLDRIDPFQFDKDRNGELSRSEAERAFFSALDLDGDGVLSRHELSRYPGATRDLRFGDAQALEAFGRIDRNRDSSVSVREFRIEDREWQALDADRSGAVRLVAPTLQVQRARGLVAPGSEWPSSRADLVLLPPGIKIEALLAGFDRDGDGALSSKELSSRPDLLSMFDANHDHTADRGEITRVLARVDDQGVNALADDFLGRWDLDGNGKVEGEELPAGVQLRIGSD